MGKIIELKGYDEEVRKAKYAIGIVATDLTNTESLMLEVITFNKFSELKRQGFDKDEIAEIEEMGAGNTMFNDNYWNIIRIK